MKPLNQWLAIVILQLLWYRSSRPVSSWMLSHFSCEFQNVGLSWIKIIDLAKVLKISGRTVEGGCLMTGGSEGLQRYCNSLIK